MIRKLLQTQLVDEDEDLAYEQVSCLTQAKIQLVIQ